MTGDEPGPPPGTYWDELERSFADLDAIQPELAVALHPAGRGPRGEILRQLDRIEHDLGRARAALRWMAIGLALQLGVAIVLVYALATRR